MTKLQKQKNDSFLMLSNLITLESLFFSVFWLIDDDFEGFRHGFGNYFL
jgi:hypothetical protein